MATPDQGRVRQIIEPRKARLASVVLSSWDRWMLNPDRPLLYRRCRAGLVHNYMMLDAIPNLPDDPAIHCIERHESALFLLEDELLIRFKKGDEKGLSRNIGTQFVLAFNDPDEPIKLFDFPDIQRVDIAYRLNDLETKVRDILVVARKDDEVLWSFPIYEAAKGADTETIPLPISPVEPPAADSGMRVPEQEDEKQQRDGVK